MLPFFMGCRLSVSGSFSISCLAVTCACYAFDHGIDLPTVNGRVGLLTPLAMPADGEIRKLRCACLGGCALWHPQLWPRWWHFWGAWLPFKTLRKDAPKYGKNSPLFRSCMPRARQVMLAVHKPGWRLLWVTWCPMAALTVRNLFLLHV